MTELYLRMFVMNCMGTLAAVPCGGNVGSEPYSRVVLLVSVTRSCSSQTRLLDSAHFKQRERTEGMSF